MDRGRRHHHHHHHHHQHYQSKSRWEKCLIKRNWSLASLFVYQSSFPSGLPAVTELVSTAHRQIYQLLRVLTSVTRCQSNPVFHFHIHGQTVMTQSTPSQESNFYCSIVYVVNCESCDRQASQVCDPGQFLMRKVTAGHKIESEAGLCIDLPRRVTRSKARLGCALSYSSMPRDRKQGWVVHWPTPTCHEIESEIGLCIDLLRHVTLSRLGWALTCSGV